MEQPTNADLATRLEKAEEANQQLRAKLDKLEQRHLVVSTFIAQFAAAVARDGLNKARVDEVFKGLRPGPDSDKMYRQFGGFEVNFLEEEFRRWAPK